MSALELSMLGFIGLVVGTGIGWLIYDSRSENEK